MFCQMVSRAVSWTSLRFLLWTIIKLLQLDLQKGDITYLPYAHSGGTKRKLEILVTSFLK